jgi:hypothetical protein
VGHGVRGDAIPAEASGRDLGLEEREGGPEAAIELLAQRGLLATVPALRVREEVLGVVEEADVERVEREPVERAFELVGEELRMEAVPAPVHVLHHLGERPAGGLALAGEAEVLALDVADLRHHDHRLPMEGAAAGQLGEDGADEALAAPVGVVRGGVDQAHAPEERLLERCAVLRGLVVHAVAAEPEAAHREAGGSEARVGRGAECPREAGSSRRCLRRCRAPRNGHGRSLIMPDPPGASQACVRCGSMSRHGS